MHKFWEERASEIFWYSKWSTTLSWHPPHAKWFIGGTTNASVNCLDRQVEAGLGGKAAIIWEGEPGETRTITYAELLSDVSRFANALRKIGITSGDRVVIYMPLVPEAVVAMLACARIGAPHSVIFGGFSAEAIRDRVHDCGAKLIVTADGGYRRGEIVPLKANVNQALAAGMPTVERVIVLKRTGQKVAEHEIDLYWHDIVINSEEQCVPEICDSEHPLFILYTSGTTGKPKGILHTTGGYMVQTKYSSKAVFDLQADDIYWCTADIGWITGHSYVVYGPLANGATIFMYEGSPDFPDRSRFWSLIEKHHVSIFYTAPTAIRSFMRWGDLHISKHDLSSLRLLGSVGEPINPAAWEWYHKTIGHNRCPIVDTWWQTETGSIMISPIPWKTALKAGSATHALPGIDAAVVNNHGEPCETNEPGFLVIKQPWPSMLRGIYNDMQRYQEQYFSRFGQWYFTGDGARIDEDGCFWILGRIDDVLNVAGHRLSTAEIESALVSHPSVAEAAVVGAPDEIKGEAVVAFVVIRQGMERPPHLTETLKEHVVKAIGAIARPRDIRVTEALPKTRSGKIMRRLLRELAASGEIKGDTTTLEDIRVIEALREED